MNHTHNEPEHVHDESCAAAASFAQTISEMIVLWTLRGYDPAAALVSVVIAAMQAVEESPEWWALLRSRLIEADSAEALPMAAQHIIHLNPLSAISEPQA